MTGLHLHLLINHAPILGAWFALALLVASLRFAPDVLRRTALVVLIGVAVAGFVAKLSGDPAEEGVRGLPGVQRRLIHAHEEAADGASIAAIVVGVGALGALIRWRRTPVPAAVTGAAFVGTIVVAGWMSYTGLLGGQVRHTEVRPGATRADAAVVESLPPRGMRPPEGEEH